MSKPKIQFFSQHVVVPDHVLIQELDGESVILELDSENYYGLDDIGTRMWQLLCDAGTIQEAFDTLLLEFDVEPQLLQRDLQDLISQLAAKGLLQLDSDHSREK